MQIFAVTFPFFALVLCGYVATRAGWLSLAAIPGLNGFVLYFALPCMLYRFGSLLNTEHTRLILRGPEAKNTRNIGANSTSDAERASRHGLRLAQLLACGGAQTRVTPPWWCGAWPLALAK